MAPPQSVARKSTALLIIKSACVSKEYKSFNNLNAGSYYVQYFQRITTPSGERIRVDLVDFFVYLPQRFSYKLDDDNLTELNTIDKAVVMTYAGKKSDGSPILDFDVVKFDADYDIF